MIIKTDYDPKPIPIRSFDWSAWDDTTDDDENRVRGWGASEIDAIRDLLEDIECREADTTRSSLQAQLDIIDAFREPSR
jgi:hypothetical protein